MILFREKGDGAVKNDDRKSWITAKADNGRPSIDPVQLVKYLLIGFLYNINSEREIEIEI